MFEIVLESSSTYAELIECLGNGGLLFCELGQFLLCVTGELLDFGLGLIGVHADKHFSHRKPAE
jgi:hypothetical protein